MQVRCRIQRYENQIKTRLIYWGPQKLVVLGECWIEEADDDKVRHDRICETVMSAGCGVDFYALSTDKDYTYHIYVY